VRPIAAVLLAAALAALPSAAQARPGDADPGFATGGRTAFTVGASSARVAGLALRAGDRALVAGTAVLPDGRAATSVSQLDPFGALDPAFATAGTTLVDPVPTTLVEPAGIALAPDGSAIVATTVTDPADGHQKVHVVRVPATGGGADPAFGDHGVAVLDFTGGNVHGDDVAIDDRGRILIAASTERDGARYMSCFRLTPDGHRDRRFAGGRVDLDSRAFAGAVLPRPGGGAIVAGGLLRSYGNIVAVQVDDRGRRLDRFGGGRAHVRLAQRTRRGTGARDMVLGADGSLTIAAVVRPKGARDRIAVARLSARGRLVRSFARGGVFTAGTQSRPLTVQRMARDAKGRFVLAGTAKNPATGGENALVLRLTAAGLPDRSFGSSGAVVRRMGGAAGARFVDSRANAVVVAGGRVWVAGIAVDDDVDPVHDLGRAWPAVMRLLG
jgi:uncharacterized delta-60 repeat protein